MGLIFPSLSRSRSLSCFSLIITIVLTGNESEQVGFAEEEPQGGVVLALPLRVEEPEPPAARGAGQLEAAPAEGALGLAERVISARLPPRSFLRKKVSGCCGEARRGSVSVRHWEGTNTLTPFLSSGFCLLEGYRRPLARCLLVPFTG